MSVPDYQTSASQKGTVPFSLALIIHTSASRLHSREIYIMRSVHPLTRVVVRESLTRPHRPPVPRVRPPESPCRSCHGSAPGRRGMPR